jgi:hypothetical protein
VRVQVGARVLLSSDLCHDDGCILLEHQLENAEQDIARFRKNSDVSEEI